MSKRIQIEVPDSVVQALEELADREGETAANAVAKAILTRNYLSKKSKEKGRVLLEEGDGSVSEVVLK